MKKNKKLEGDKLVYTLLLSSFLILFITLNKYSFNLNETSISYSYLIVPIILLITNLIHNKFKDIEILNMILLSIVLVFVYVTVIDFSLQIPIIYNELLRPILSITMSIIINFILFKILSKYRYLYGIIVINYLFGIITYDIIYNLIIININLYEYLYILIIQLLITIIISIFDKKKFKFN